MQYLKKVVSCFVLVNFLAYGPLFTGAAAAATPAAKPAAAKPAAGKPAAGKQVNGKQLLAESKKAVAGILKESKASGGKLDPKSKKQAPFFAGLKEFQGAIDDSEKKLKAKDKKLFASLSKGSKALAKVKTAWPRVGVKNAKVDGYLGKLDNSYTALRSRYGGEGVRAKQGAALSAKEKANFEKIKSSPGRVREEARADAGQGKEERRQGHRGAARPAGEAVERDRRRAAHGGRLHDGAAAPRLPRGRVGLLLLLRRSVLSRRLGHDGRLGRRAPSRPTTRSTGRPSIPTRSRAGTTGMSRWSSTPSTKSRTSTTPIWWRPTPTSTRASSTTI